MLSGEMSGVIDITVGIVDVRDVTQAHIIAMEKPECNGKHYLLVSENNVPFLTFTQVINKEFGTQGCKAGTLSLLHGSVFSKFNADMSLIYPCIGKRIAYVNDRMINELGIQP